MFKNVNADLLEELMAKLLSLREFRRPILSDLVARLVFVCMLVCFMFVCSIDFIFWGHLELHT